MNANAPSGPIMPVEEAIPETTHATFSMIGRIVDLAPLPALIISLIALIIGLVNLRSQMLASFSAYWVSPTGFRFLVVKNTGRGTAKISNIQIQNSPGEDPIDLTYVEDRHIFPLTLGSGAVYEIQLDKKQTHPMAIRVEWRDGRFRQQTQLVSVSTMKSRSVTDSNIERPFT